MIKLEHIETFNWEGALRGMRNPMNSWEKSDSYHTDYDDGDIQFVVGPNDLDLCKRLCKSGSDHRKFARQIFISMDITAPLYYFKEFDTYKVSTVSNSCSTMHKIMAKEFVIEDFSTDQMLVIAKESISRTIEDLNSLRNTYLEEKDVFTKKIIWYSIIQLLPSSYNQKRTITLNYEIAYNMYQARKVHKLDEWKELCKTFLIELPYFCSMFDIGDKNDKRISN